MSTSTAARAAARRQAILARGSDRLSKLTTSARGEDAPQFPQEDIPAPPPPDRHAQPLRSTLVSEAAHQRVPPARASSLDVFGIGSPPDLPAWSPEQRQFLRALMDGENSTGLPFDTSPQSGGIATQPSVPDMLANIIGEAPLVQPSKSHIYPHKLLPFIHLLSVWILVAYYALFAEPTTSKAPVSPHAYLHRWASLASEPPLEALWGSGPMLFIWALIMLELGLHSIRIFTGMDKADPPMFLAIALPHLPSNVSATIRHGLKYMKMAGALFDDLASAIFALAVGVVTALYLESWMHK